MNKAEAFKCLVSYFDDKTTPRKAVDLLGGGVRCFDDTGRVPEFLWNVVDDKLITLTRTADFKQKLFPHMQARPGLIAHMRSMTVAQCRDFLKARP